MAYQSFRVFSHFAFLMLVSPRDFGACKQAMSDAIVASYVHTLQLVNNE
jgi:hypothetical protein